MNEIVVARDIDIVTTEINTIKVQTQRMIVANAIEIGRRLVEVKSMVPYGEWGKYLQERVDYSESTANNLMQLYKEYGSNQESLFDSFTKSQAFGNLTYTKALALLAIPAEEREDFVEHHDVESMSTRELKQAIKERDEARLAQQNAERELAEAEEKIENAYSQCNELEKDVRRADQEAEKLRAQVEEANANQAAATQEVEKIKAKLEKAVQKEKKAKEDLKNLQENPTIPDAVMEQMRKEAEAEAAKQAKEELEKQMKDAQKSVDAAKKAKEDAEKAVQEMEQKLAAAEKLAKLSNPDMAVFKNILEGVVQDINRLHGCFLKIKTAAPDSAEGLKKAMLSLSDQIQQIVADE